MLGHWLRVGRHPGLLLVRFALLLLSLGACYAHSQEIVTYGPWEGWWTKARLSAYSPHDELDRAYHETKGERWRWITADGKTDVRSSPHGIAAPSSIPFGTRIVVGRGSGFLDASRTALHQRVFTVDDRGSALGRPHVDPQWIRLDLRYRTESSALAFGVKDAWVFIITGDSK